MSSLMPEMSGPPHSDRRSPTIRKAVRVPVSAEVRLRRSGQPAYRLEVVDMTPSGCRVHFVDRPHLDEQVLLKFDGLEALPATVCWVRGFEAGLELDKPMHEAVFEHVTRHIRSEPERP